ncbi:putative small lipoprotein YifL [Chryseobacterium vietnamense]|nr:putative small lipoprotein YifL [Chryseobacterium vietnamense]
MKKTIFRLFFVFAVLFTLWGCQNEEFSAEDPA